MKRTAVAFGIVALITMWAATPTRAQELELGTWTGVLTPPGGEGVPVTFEVGDVDGVLSIVMNNPQLGDISFNEARLEGGELTFWWLPGTRVDCSLLLRGDRSFEGICKDDRGADGEGRLMMMPPAR
jgi:hypothetical protein